ncbi:MAG TPA: patatin-like phospholipase family protein [Acidobacteriaceae bacterium]
MTTASTAFSAAQGAALLPAAKWNDSATTFHLGINMAGAVSAGAYTAGVLDFLMEALEQWYAAKDQPGAAVPRHKLVIDVFSGASAGGMCAAISAVMVNSRFDHIHDPANPDVTNTSNKFYESWVNKIDIEHLLDLSDIHPGQPIRSLLDSDIIDQIAEYAIQPPAFVSRPYISPSLNLFLSLTNIRGVPYSLDGSADGSAEQQIAYYADRLQFETVRDGNPLISKRAQPLPVGTAPVTGPAAWPLLKEAAKATGAFPIFLASRKLDRDALDYQFSPWRSIASDPVEIIPDWRRDPSPAPFTTLNVDGGLTDNDPFQLAHDFLAVHNPSAAFDRATGELANPRSSTDANCAVLTVAPFPASCAFKEDYDFDKQGSVLGVLPNLFTALISQSRFFGESLTAVLGGNSYSRFVLAPTDAENPKVSALQCGILNAFGGFFERGFRAHDYQLGRRNCQKFLKDHFRLSIDNPIIQSGLPDKADPHYQQLMQAHDPGASGTLPIIPLCGSAVPEATQPARAKITNERVDQIVSWAVKRMHAIGKPLIQQILGDGLGSRAVHGAVDLLIATEGKSKLEDYLRKQLDGLIEG